MKNIVVKLCLIIAMTGMSGLLNAQSVRMNATINQPTREAIRKLANNTFEKLPAGIVSYKLIDNKIWALFSGVPEDNCRGSYVRTDQRIDFYNSTNLLMGYYTFSDGRFYVAYGKKDADGKLSEETRAVLLDKILYINEPGGFVREYTVDSGITLEILGFYLFII